MKTCKIKPPVGACMACYDLEEVPHCLKCSYNTTRHELIDVKPGILDDYAIIISEGKILKVSLSRVYDVKEEDTNV